jgi:hypothetical protein
MIEVVTTWEEFRNKWDSRQNFILRGEIFPHQFNPAALETVVDTIRSEEQARVLKGRTGLMSSYVQEPFPEYRNLPIDEAIRCPVSLTHFELNRFTGASQPFAGLDTVIDQWYSDLASQGFRWGASQRAFFMSGPHCYSNYHFDSSYVLVWQIAGTKRFCWLKDPERWCSPEVLREQADHYEKMKMPSGITPEDVVECEMQPGDVLWNVMLTPHWVYAAEEPSYSFNITHFDLHCDDHLSAISLTHERIRQERQLAESVGVV